MNTIDVKGVTKRFGALVALDDVTFTVQPGRLTGFVGANGAGKTTTMRVIMGLLLPDKGEAAFGGQPLTLAARRTFGYMPEERGLYPRMKIADQLRYFGRLHGLDAATSARRVGELLQDLGLADRADEELTKLSLGNQQRVQVAAALIHNPQALILDEPFSGLDPLAVDSMAELIRGRTSAGAPVLFSSHQLDLVERLCDDIVILSGGRVVAAGDARELRLRHARDTYHVRLASPEQAAALARDLPDGVGNVTKNGGDSLDIELSDPSAVDALVAAAQRAGSLRELTPHLPTLSEVFHEVIA